jgi:hypothetical protein
MPKLWYILFENDSAFAEHSNFKCYMCSWAVIFSVHIHNFTILNALGRNKHEGTPVVYAPPVV